MRNSLSKKNIYLKNISEYLVLWAVGGCIYYGIEVLFRGFSHISMFMLGGLCMQFFTWQGRLTEWQDALPRQITRCTIFVVSMESVSYTHLDVYKRQGSKEGSISGTLTIICNTGQSRQSEILQLPNDSEEQIEQLGE